MLSGTMAESGVALGVANPKVSKMRRSARRRHRTPARYSFQPVIAAKSLSRASCSQIKAQQEVLYSRVRQGPDGRKQRHANDAELENSGARAGIGVRVETAGLRKLVSFICNSRSYHGVASKPCLIPQRVFTGQP